MLRTIGHKSLFSCLAKLHKQQNLETLITRFHGSAVPVGDELGRLLIAHPRSTSHASLAEALRLAETYTGRKCPHFLVGSANGSSFEASTFLGRGAIASLQDRCSAGECQEVFVNAQLSPVQHRNLERAMGISVIDRVGLIIKIFAQRAQTREAKLQIQLAALEYESSRLVRVLDDQGQRVGFGQGGIKEVVSARERARGGSGGGGLGGGGAGEKELNLQKHKILARKKRVQLQIEGVRKTRMLQRQGRKRSNVPVVAVVGYTNAGKSTLVSKLTRKELGQDDLLFKTLDPALRRLVLPSGKVLHNLGLTSEAIQVKVIEVWNKSDKSGEIIYSPSREWPEPLAPDATLTSKLHVSAVNGTGLLQLKDLLDKKLGAIYKNRKWAPDWVTRTCAH